jgi:lipopolysaccharide/colanic/teichoic acid biosynthesis glycosyltransferase
LATVPHLLPRGQGRLKLPTLQKLITHPEFAATPAADFAGVPLWKRVLDICCVMFAGATLLPMLLLIAIAIKLGSKGPVLFKQERIGLCGKRFIIFKFRTMIPSADTSVHESHVAALIENNKPMAKLDANGDPRVTAFGRLLRVAGLDELPQFINVLRGEMSIVGPRPCLPSEFNKYLPWQRERFLTRPGLTGLWQVSGKNRTTFNEMIDLDVQYVRERSLWLDLKIILKTIPAVMAEVRDIQSPRRHVGLPVRPVEGSLLVPHSNPGGDRTGGVFEQLKRTEPPQIMMG